MPKIQTIIAREIFDSRGTPTVEVDLTLADGSFGRASVPSGASTGVHEAVELRDGGDRLRGTGVLTACKNVETIILTGVVSTELNQAELDHKMIELDGTPNKGKLGANAILAVSLAFAKAVAISTKQPLWEYFRALSSTAPDEYLMPMPMMNILNGGQHADQSTDIQEYMIMPISAKSFAQAMEIGVNVFGALKQILKKAGFATTVGDEGGFAPKLKSNQSAFDLIIQAIKDAGYEPGKDVALAIDAAASEFYKDGKYNFSSENRTLEPAEIIDQYAKWTSEYPIISIEDGLAEDAWTDWQTLTEKLGSKIQLVGDDLFVTNVDRLKMGIEKKAGNAILVKLNQIGTVTETIAAIDLARKNNFNAIVSHRSGETEDTTIADLVVGLSTGQIKTGSLSRTERMAKYNQLLRIEEILTHEKS